MSKKLSYDGHGINGPEPSRRRLATFTEDCKQNGTADHFGPMWAAAPELLEALEYLLLDIQGAEELGLPLSAIPSSAESLKDAEAAIRKAKGEQ